MPPKTAPSTPAYELQIQAAILVARMNGDDSYSPGADLDTFDPAPPTPDEIAEWTRQADRAIERRCYVAAELRRQMEQADAERAKFADRRDRLKAEIERVKAPALALMLAKRDMGEVDAEGKVRVKTACVSAWLIETESVEGPEDGAAWPPEFQRVKIEPDKQKAKAWIENGGEIPGVCLRANTGIGWRS